MADGFVIKCRSCKWIRHTTGLSKDISDLKEIASTCSKCGKPRKFRCPMCRGVAIMTRVFS